MIKSLKIIKKLFLILAVIQKIWFLKKNGEIYEK